MFLAIGLGIGIGKIAQVENWYWNYYWKNHFQYYWYWNCYCKNSFQHYWYWYWSQNFGIDHLCFCPILHDITRVDKEEQVGNDRLIWRN